VSRPHGLKKGFFVKVNSSGIENGRNFVRAKEENLCNHGSVQELGVPSRLLARDKFFSQESIPATSEVHCEPLGTGCGGMDNSMGLL